MQLCIPGGHCEPLSRGTWAKGYGLSAWCRSFFLPLCSRGRKGKVLLPPQETKEEPAVLNPKPAAHCTLVLLQPSKIAVTFYSSAWPVSTLIDS